MSDERNPYDLDPEVFATDLWEKYLESGDITLLPRRQLLLASTVSLEWAADNNDHSVLLFQPENIGASTQRGIVTATYRKFDGLRAHAFDGGKLFVAGRADKTIGQVLLKPGYTPAFEIRYSPRWALARPDAIDDLCRSQAVKDFLANTGS